MGFYGISETTDYYFFFFHFFIFFFLEHPHNLQYYDNHEY